MTFSLFGYHPNTCR